MNTFSENTAVGQLAEIVALERGYAPAKARQVRIAGNFHDYGKQKIAVEILNKPGKLTEEEYAVVKTHTWRGAAMLSSIQGELGEMMRLTAMYHHEWNIDGGGYWGRRFGELPHYIEIISITDLYMALVSKRPYKAAWSPTDALAYIQKQAGTRFDAVFAEFFISLIQNDSRVPKIFQKHQEVV